MMCFSICNCSRAFWDKRISQEVNGEAMGDVWLALFTHIHFDFQIVLNKMILCFNSLIDNFRSSRGMSSRLWEVVTNKVSP